jgi:hypothetical protein
MRMLVAGIVPTEPAPVQDVYCDGIALIETKGPNVRIVLFEEEEAIIAGEPSEYRVVAKLIGPIGALQAALTVVQEFLSRLARPEHLNS